MLSTIIDMLLLTSFIILKDVLFCLYQASAWTMHPLHLCINTLGKVSMSHIEMWCSWWRNCSNWWLRHICWHRKGRNRRGSCPDDGRQTDWRKIYLLEGKLDIDVELVIEFADVVGVVHEGVVLAGNIKCFGEGEHIGFWVNVDDNNVYECEKVEQIHYMML